MDKKLIVQGIAHATLDIEAKTILALKASINADFEMAVNLILACKGRLVITGVGKSALIAQKIVATFNSTGTPALFMHAADAIHGDLGMVQKEDVVLCISKSGETPEIKALLPFIKEYNTPLIGMVGHRASYLGQQADWILHTPVPREADPNNLAPTASTTAQLALGDALALSVMKLKGFAAPDFARVHPGGMLGKYLYLRVKDLYSGHEKPAVRPSSGIRETIMEITSKRLGATAVTDDEGKLLGIITDGDLRRMLEKTTDISTLRAADIMTPAPKRIKPSALAVKALEVLRAHSISQVVVAEDSGEYCGIVHLHDLIREGLV